MLQFLAYPLIFFLNQLLKPLLERLNHGYFLKFKLLAVPYHIVMLKCISLLAGISHSVNEQAMCSLLKLKLRKQFLVHSYLISHFLPNLSVPHVVQLVLKQSFLRGFSVGNSDTFEKMSLFSQQFIVTIQFIDRFLESDTDHATRQGECLVTLGMRSLI